MNKRRKDIDYRTTDEKIHDFVKENKMKIFTIITIYFLICILICFFINKNAFIHMILIYILWLLFYILYLKSYYIGYGILILLALLPGISTIFVLWEYLN